MNIEITKDVSCLEIDKIEFEKKAYKIFKRVIDIIGALVGCVILVPLIIGVWIANYIYKDNGPIFHVQKRIGKNGKPFKMYKFRSMKNNADKVLKTYLQNNPERNKEFNVYRKLKEDPRITKVGKFIRRTSIDEFPQFINILKGDMTLIGPRPYLFREKRAMGKAYGKIIKVKPGLTGPWQVDGRSEKPLKDRLEMDMCYVENCCITDDIKYFFQTFKKIFERKGAI